MTKRRKKKTRGDLQTAKRRPERGANAFESRSDGSLVIYATMPDGDGEPIRVEPHRVGAVLAACGDALAGRRSVR